MTHVQIIHAGRIGLDDKGDIVLSLDSTHIMKNNVREVIHSLELFSNILDKIQKEPASE